MFQASNGAANWNCDERDAMLKELLAIILPSVHLHVKASFDNDLETGHGFGKIFTEVRFRGWK